MILLETGNRLLADTVRSVIIPDPDYKPQPFEVKLYDFDQSSFLVQVPEDNTQKLVISLGLPCYKQIKDLGAEDALKAAYGAYLGAPSGEYDAVIEIDSSQWSGKEEETIDLISRFKRIALGGIYDHYLTKLNKGESSSLQPFKFDLRPDTTVYFVPGSDRVQVIYHLSFIDQADIEIGRVFLTEFADPSLRRKVQRAPLVNFDINVPTALKTFGALSGHGKGTKEVGFVSFTMLPLHATDSVRGKVVESLQVFRNFVQYHLKCAKAYFHSRMRARVVDFVKVLNRARFNSEETNKPKRITTAAGRVLIK